MTGEACQRAGCSGSLEEGFCSECGHAAAKAAASPPRKPEAVPPRGNLQQGTQHVSAAQVVPMREPGRQARAQGGLGGLSTLPEIEVAAPESTVLTDLRVPEHKRFCHRCEGHLRRESGFCPQCGAKFSFAPTLHAGDCVANQYEVRGPLAFGGLGWIYLAFDRLLSRYVVLKGLLNAQDAAAANAAVTERQFLAAVRHPNIVSIYSFVEAAGEGFIVMEHIGGVSLRQLRVERGPLPPLQVLAVMHRVLAAIIYLHGQGLVYCDLKPDNIMLDGSDVRLIDLGSVRQAGDAGGEIYGTVGYSAPEAGEGPTPASDVFTAGRTLAVLLADLPEFGGTHRYTLPASEAMPLFAAEPSLHRLLLRATAREPAERFPTARAMVDQVQGVWREISAGVNGRPQAGTSEVFGTDLLALQAADPLEELRPSPHLLPRPLPDPGDGATLALENALLLPDASRRLVALRALWVQYPASTEVQLRLAALLIDLGGLGEAERLLAGVTAVHGEDWRRAWFEGMLAMRRGEAATAMAHFDRVYAVLPGELAPKLAMGVASELAGDLPRAMYLYRLVSRVDPSFVSALFGLARCAARLGDRTGAAAALKRVEATSALFLRGRVAAIRTLLALEPNPPQASEVLAAAELLESLPLDRHDRALLTEEVLCAGLAVARREPAPREAPVAQLLGTPMQEGALRLRLEAVLRERAQAANGAERIRLVDAANRVRPRTWL